MFVWSFSAHGGVFPGKTTAEVISICKQAGFSGLEGNVNAFSEKTSSELEAIAAEYRRAGLYIKTFPCHSVLPLTQQLFMKLSGKRQYAISASGWSEPVC